MRIISGTAKGKKIHTPEDKNTRPLKDMVKESIFNILDHSNLLNKNLEDCTILDLFSGVGSFGLEAISRGAKKVVFFENYKPAIKLLTKNIDLLSFNKKSEVNEINIETNNPLEKLDYNFNLVFIDPPFNSKNLNKILENLFNSKTITFETLIILHRHKKADDQINSDIKIVREEIYGLSKINFCYFNF